MTDPVKAAADRAEITGTKQRGAPFKKGQSGNPAGRPKGSRNKLQEDFLRDMCDLWGSHGYEALKRVAESQPDVFVKVCASLMPKELKAEIEHRAVMRMPEVSGTIDQWLSEQATSH